MVFVHAIKVPEAVFQKPALTSLSSATVCASHSPHISWVLRLFSRFLGCVTSILLFLLNFCLRVGLCGETLKCCASTMMLKMLCYLS